MSNIIRTTFLALCLALVLPSLAFAQGAVCARPAAGSEVAQPPDLFSKNGVLSVDLYYLTTVDNWGRTLFCFQTPSGQESPTLHVNPGEEIRINLTNKLQAAPGAPSEVVSNDKKRCGSTTMTATTVNMHFHGTNTSPTCHSDEVIHTLVNSGETFQYVLKIPKNEPPGLYWFHPHVHGIASNAVEGGATAMIEVEGIANIQPIVAGLPVRYLAIRDQVLTAVLIPPLHKPGTDDSLVPYWDLSLNYVPVSYPQYQTAIIKMNPGKKEFWRVVNSAANTIVDLQVTYDGAVQPLQIVAFDGVPTGSQDGTRQGTVVTQKHVLLPPAARVEFVIKAPSASVRIAKLETLKVDTGSGGDITPVRPLATIQTTNGPTGLTQVLKQTGTPNEQRFEGLADAKVTAHRVLYFSEYPGNLAGSNALPGRPPGEPPFHFFITVRGQNRRLFDPNEPPAIITRRGAVEEWTLQNTSYEVHDFHMHQIHFLVEAINGVPIPKKKQQFYDSFQVPYWTGKGPFSSIKVKMDFRGAVVGDFVYHCHILQHEDGGMMAIIRVLPPKKA